MASEEAAKAQPAVIFTLVDAAGHLLVGGRLEATPGWQSRGSYGVDPLTLLPPGPGADLPLLSDVRDVLAETLYQAVDSSVILYVPDPAKPNQPLPYPEHPSQAIYIAKFPDGVELFVRLPEEFDAPRGEVAWQGQTVSFAAMTPLGFALRQTEGSAAQNREKLNLYGWVAAADIHSLIASTTGFGQEQALNVAMLATHKLLDGYRQERGAYPATLEDLWQGDKAVVSRAPSNPFAWPEPLCVTGGETQPRFNYKLDEDGTYELLTVG